MRFVLIVLLSCCLLSHGHAEIGDDGLHKQDWFSLTFKDIAEDISEASGEGKRLVILFEQKGCIYCEKLHETLLSDPGISDYIKTNFNVVQMNMFGDEEITDLDGEVLSEKEAVRKWNVVFTPLLLFMPDKVSTSANAGEAAVARMPGAFGKLTFLNMFKWVSEKRYESGEHFQQYHARMLAERKAAGESVKE